MHEDSGWNENAWKSQPSQMSKILIKTNGLIPVKHLHHFPLAMHETADWKKSLNNTTLPSGGQTYLLRITDTEISFDIFYTSTGLPPTGRIH